MMIRAVMTCALLLLSVPALTQQGIPIVGTERLAWDQVAASLADAQGFAYTPLVDTATPTGSETAFVGVTCTGAASPFVCSAPVPTLTPGLHELRVVASVAVGSTVLASAPSSPVQVQMTVAPAAPTNLQIASAPPPPQPPPDPPGPVGWVAPIGIPVPDFGITQTHLMYVDQDYAYSTGSAAYKDAGDGPYTHYVHNTAGCTNSSNNYGSAATPRCSMPVEAFIAPGAVIELHGALGGTSQQSQVFIGTATAPIFVRGANASTRPTITSKEILARGQYVIYEHLEFITIGPTARSINESAHHLAFRDLYIHDNDAGIGVTGTSAFTTHHIVVYRNLIQGNGFDPEGGEFPEDDGGGVGIDQYTEDVWVVDNDISGQSGDAVGAGHDDNYTSKRWYIGRNRLHGTGENAVDLKEVDGVVVSQNLMYNLQGLSSGSSGTAIVVHYGPDVSAKNVWVLYNHIYDVRDVGIQVGGSQEFETYFIGNILHDIHNDGLTAKAFETFGSCKINLVGNVFYNTDNGIKASGTGGCGQLIVKNNIVSAIRNPTGYYIDNLSDSNYEAALQCSHNLFFPAGPTRDGTCTSGVASDPLFVNAAGGDFRLQAGSPAIDAGDATIMTTLADAYEAFFGVNVYKDFMGLVRPQGGGWDIGAHERAP